MICGLQPINNGHRCSRTAAQVAKYVTTGKRDWIKHCVLQKRKRKERIGRWTLQPAYIVAIMEVYRAKLHYRQKLAHQANGTCQANVDTHRVKEVA